jgi:hypothetical protein
MILHHASNIKQDFKLQTAALAVLSSHFALKQRDSIHSTMSFRADFARNLLLLPRYEEADSSPEKPGSE